LITLLKILEADDIHDGFLVVSYQIIVALYLAFLRLHPFLGGLQTTAIACHQESIFSLDYRGCKCLVATQIEGLLCRLDYLGCKHLVATQI
jgi:hypothetical protein